MEGRQHDSNLEATCLTAVAGELLAVLVALRLVQHQASAGVVVTCLASPATIDGTPGDDVLLGTDGDDVIIGFERGGDDDLA